MEQFPSPNQNKNENSLAAMPLDELKQSWIAKRTEWLNHTKAFSEGVKSGFVQSLSMEERTLDELSFQDLTAEVVDLQDELKKRGVNMDDLEAQIPG